MDAELYDQIAATLTRIDDATKQARELISTASEQAFLASIDLSPSQISPWVISIISTDLAEIRGALDTASSAVLHCMCSAQVKAGSYTKRAEHLRASKAEEQATP